VNFYLDTSIIVSLLTAGRFSARAEAFARAHRDELLVSDFSAAEFSSVIARRVRAGELLPEDGRTTLADFDTWRVRAVLRVEIAPGDVAQADGYMRRLDLALRTPDAIHIAMTQRCEASLVTFDHAMATAARALGVSVADA
jgi:predicted nucleic acid-binding protein